jgi:hypothetical protein
MRSVVSELKLADLPITRSLMHFLQRMHKIVCDENIQKETQFVRQTIKTDRKTLSYIHINISIYMCMPVNKSLICEHSNEDRYIPPVLK